MNRKVLYIFTFLFLMSLMIFSSCFGVIKGSGRVETRLMDFSDFDKIEIGHSFTYEIVKSDSYKVSISLDDNLYEYSQISLSGSTLKISMDWKYSYRSSTMKAVIELPELKKLHISGATKGTIDKINQSKPLEIDISGASSLDGNFVVGDLELEVSGNSKVDLDCRVKKLDVNISGASKGDLEGSGGDSKIVVSGASLLNLMAFDINNADINLSGSSNLKIDAKGVIEGSVSGASKLIHSAKSKLGDIDVSGASEIVKAE